MRRTIRCIQIIGLPFILFDFAVADPPDPPLGKRWTFNPLFSDEFNGTELDLSKWYNYHPAWKGRPPGLFLPSQVSVKNGCLELRGEKMERDTIIYDWKGNPLTFNVASGIVVSRTQEAYFGYYECRFKAAKTTMSSTFWFSTRQNYEGPAACNDKYQLEWDVQECIGREGNFSGSWFAKGMHSNAHFWYTGCDGVKNDLRAPDVRFESDELASENFNVYGGWWKNENEASYYYNNGEAKSHRFTTSVKSKPFDRPMGMNLASETYPYPWISLPTDEELADTSRNVCRYDWVRAYTLVDVDEPINRERIDLHNPGFETGDFSYWTGWGTQNREVVTGHAHSGNYAAHVIGPGAPEYEVSLRSHSTYVLSCYGKVSEGSKPVIFGIKDGDGNVLGSVQVSGNEYSRYSFDFSTGSSGIQLKFYFYAPDEGVEGWADDFELFRYNEGEEPEETDMFHDQIWFSGDNRQRTSRRTLDFQLVYKARADRDIHFRLYNPEDMLVGENVYQALAGFGRKVYSMNLDSILTAGNSYQLVADIRPVASGLADTFQTDAFKFDLIEPLEVSLTVLDLRDSTPLAGAQVVIGDSMKVTGADGRTSFHGMDPGVVPVQVRKEGFVDYSSTEHTVQQDTSLVIYMTPLSHSLTFSITHLHTGNPLKDALVRAADESAISDYSGKAVLSLYEGDHQVSISLERYAVLNQEVSVNRDTTLRVELDQLLADAKFVVKLDNSGLYGATISLDETSETTSPVGIASFKDLKTDTLYHYKIKNNSEYLSEDSLVLQTDTTLRFNFTSGTTKGPGSENGPLLFPNPANSKILLGGIHEGCIYTVCDMKGRALIRGSLGSSKTIDVSELESGVYLLKAGNRRPMRFIVQ